MMIKYKDLYINFYKFISDNCSKYYDLSINLYEESLRDYNFKIKVKKNKENFEKDIVIYYSPKKNRFTFNFADKINSFNIENENILKILSSLAEEFLNSQKFSEKNIKNNNLNLYPEKLDEIQNTGELNTQNVNDNEIFIYVDGSYIDGETGYGGVILSPKNIVLYEYYGKINDENIKRLRQIGGEIESVVIGLKWVKENIKNYKDYKIKIFYDYEGLEKWVKGLWKVKNIQTFNYKNEILNFLNENIEIEWIKIKSHSGNKWNDYVDQLAKKGAKKNI
ncbi:MAG: hypothetical protein N3A58_04120 [Spirochaetes bacterium]|nr:hypothetical protein [Spirochaetota bacterium]